MLYKFLSSIIYPLIHLSLPFAESPKLRNSARSGVARCCAETYQKLYEALHCIPGGTGYESIFIHSPEQIKTLLDVL